jgi:hypothetical protein
VSLSGQSLLDLVSAAARMLSLDVCQLGDTVRPLWRVSVLGGRGSPVLVASLFGDGGCEVFETLFHVAGGSLERERASV